MDDLHYYFAYGSNLVFDRMKRRCPSAQFFSKVVLPDYALIFSTSDTEQVWGEGAGADIVPQKGAFVEGVIYSMALEDFQKLDALEYAYRRDTVALPGHEHLAVWTYFVEDKHEGLLPSLAYLETIIKGARAQGLSVAYIETLERWRAFPCAAGHVRGE